MKLLNDTADIQNIEKIRFLDESIKKSTICVYKSYAGFPILRGGKFADKFVIEYALLTNKALYVCNFSNEDIDKIFDYQDNVYTLVESTLKKTPTTVIKRKLICDIVTITISPGCESNNEQSYFICKNERDFIDLILKEEAHKSPLSEASLRKINAALQGAYGTVKRERRNSIENTKSAIIDEINDYIESYDDDQFNAIITDARGIQRIRGMAGSGKTIIIARKAAQLHIDHPDWNIVITYSTRSQKNQLEKLIRDYYDRLTDGDQLDSSKIRVMHAWGSANANGLYYEICLNNEIEAMNFGQAKYHFHTTKDLYDSVCGLVLTSGKALKKEYDCILIDEAQDFKSNFFKMCLKVVKDNRIVYAYDELQNLGGETMDSPNKLFGRKIEKDTPLRVCYRNQKNVIVSAHALGMGIYSGPLPIQMPSTLEVWDSIGYNCEGELDYGKNAILYRPTETSPDVIKIEEDPVNFHKFNGVNAQVNFIANCVKNDIENEGLLPKDIMIIDLDTFNAEKNFYDLKTKFNEINFHYAGKTNPEDFFREESIVYSTVFRAKGNETFMVYIINAQQVINTIETITLRNALFTAMTRSKGWVNVIGYGESMDKLVEEFNSVKSNNYKLIFNPYPTKEQLKKIRTYNNDLSKTDVEALKRTKDTIQKLLNENKRDPLLMAQDLFGVQTKEELFNLLMGVDTDGEE